MYKNEFRVITEKLKLYKENWILSKLLKKIILFYTQLINYLKQYFKITF